MKNRQTSKKQKQTSTKQTKTTNIIQRLKETTIDWQQTYKQAKKPQQTTNIEQEQKTSIDVQRSESMLSRYVVNNNIRSCYPSMINHLASRSTR